MKNAFLFAFCLCFLYGSWQGWEERQKTTSETTLLETAVSHMHLTPSLALTSHNQLEYICNTIPYFSFDLQNLHQIDFHHPPAESHWFTFEATQTVFGGATGLSLYDTGKGGFLAGTETASGELLLKKKGSIILGALSGYSVGRYITMRQPILCDSANLLDQLKDPGSSLSRTARRDYFYRRLNGLKFSAAYPMYSRPTFLDYLALGVDGRSSPDSEPASGWVTTASYLNRERDYLIKQFSYTDHTPSSHEYERAVFLFDNSLEPRERPEDTPVSKPFSLHDWWMSKTKPGAIIAYLPDAPFLSAGFMRITLFVMLAATGLFVLLVFGNAVRLAQHGTATQSRPRHHPSRPPPPPLRSRHHPQSLPSKAAPLPLARAFQSLAPASRAHPPQTHPRSDSFSGKQYAKLA